MVFFVLSACNEDKYFLVQWILDALIQASCSDDGGSPKERGVVARSEEKYFLIKSISDALIQASCCDGGGSPKGRPAWEPKTFLMGALGLWQTGDGKVNAASSTRQMIAYCKPA